MPSFTTTTMKAFADAACERKFAPVLKPHELIHNAITTMGKPRKLLLVSDNLPEHQLLLDAALASATVIAVKYDSWSLSALSDAISKSAGGTKFDAVGILDHGAPGACLLKSVGGGDIDLADLASSDIAAFLKALGGLVNPGGRIDLLGCSVAAGPGPTLLAKVEALTGVTVTASTDKTGVRRAPTGRWRRTASTLRRTTSTKRRSRRGRKCAPPAGTHRSRPLWYRCSGN